MRGNVQSARVKIKANGCGGGLGENLLAVDREFPVQHVAIGPLSGAGDRIDNRRQLSREVGEQLAGLDRARAGSYSSSRAS